jgi:hypothetical protein
VVRPGKTPAREIRSKEVRLPSWLVYRSNASLPCPTGPHLSAGNMGTLLSPCQGQEIPIYSNANSGSLQSAAGTFEI